jgi:hypothetical protein
MRALRLVPAIALIAAASCVDLAEPSIGGAYRVVLDSPFGGEGAALLEFVGPGIIGVAAPGAVVATHASGDTLRVLYVNDPQRPAAPPPVAFQLEMAPGMAVPAARVLQVADPAGRMRDFVDAYHVRYSR